MKLRPNPLELIQFGKAYKSGPKASTDLHAGGIFFCVPYEEILTFSQDGTLELIKRVIENFRPFDGQQEIDAINNFKIKGTYRLSDRKYIQCEFENYTMTGLPLQNNPDILAFHCYYTGRQGLGKAFALSK